MWIAGRPGKYWQNLIWDGIGICDHDDDDNNDDDDDDDNDRRVRKDLS